MGPSKAFHAFTRFYCKQDCIGTMGQGPWRCAYYSELKKVMSLSDMTKSPNKRNIVQGLSSSLLQASSPGEASSSSLYQYQIFKWISSYNCGCKPFGWFRDASREIHIDNMTKHINTRTSLLTVKLFVIKSGMLKSKLSCKTTWNDWWPDADCDRWILITKLFQQVLPETKIYCHLIVIIMQSKPVQKYWTNIQQQTIPSKTL